MKKIEPMDCLSICMVIIGGLNWSLVGIFNFNLIAFIFGDMTVLTRIVYIFMGLASIYLICSFPGNNLEETKSISEEDLQKDFHL